MLRLRREVAEAARGVSNGTLDHDVGFHALLPLASLLTGGRLSNNSDGAGRCDLFGSWLSAQILALERAADGRCRDG